MDEFKYSIEVFERYAIIKGKMDSWVLNHLFRLCENEGFIGIQTDGSNEGLTFVRRVPNNG